VDFENISVRVENQVGWLEYNRPPVNAVHWEMLREMPQAIQSLLEDDDVRVIAIASALEKHFSTGADLQVFAEIDVKGMREWMTIVHSLVKTLRASPKPLLAAIHGMAVGLGAELVMHCDQRFAASNARFGQPEININIVPGVGTTQSLARLLGRTRAIRFLYDGAIISAQEALAIGMVDEIVDPEELRETVQKYGETLASKPPEGLAAIRQTITSGMDLPFDEGLKIEFEKILELVQTANFKEGISAFLEKRDPKWN
jgi:enoyl-CoA hydratase/carnithine racemase